jgi:hypothetical protein
MAMDDIYRLVQAVLVDARMTRPSKYNAKNLPVGKWIEAEILSAVITGDHRTGTFNGQVWYRIKSETAILADGKPQDATFHTLWLEGWTTFEYRDMVCPPRRHAPRRRRSRK